MPPLLSTALHVLAGQWVMIDVRRPDQYEEGHAQGSVSVPMYSRIDMSKADFQKVGQQ
jgi:rhodanese-related sulfurtransferase